jgi:sterol 3beta-glucosyltransferase
VEALGVGSSVRKLNVENLAEAFVTATTDQRQIDRARLVGEQIRSVGASYKQGLLALITTA